MIGPNVVNHWTPSTTSMPLMGRMKKSIVKGVSFKKNWNVEALDIAS